MYLIREFFLFTIPYPLASIGADDCLFSPFYLLHLEHHKTCIKIFGARSGSDSRKSSE